MPEDKNDYPDWIRRIFDTKVPCMRCDEVFKVEDIIAVGLRCPHFLSGESAGPQSAVEIVCSNCDEVTQFTAACDLEDLNLGIAALFENIASHRMDASSSPSIVPFAKDDSEESADDNTENKPSDEAEEDAHDLLMGKFGGRFGSMIENQEGNKWQRRRYRRRYKLLKPPTDKEVEIFLRRLERTSIKRTTKSFRKFMEDLGISLGEDGEP